MKNAFRQAVGLLIAILLVMVLVNGWAADTESKVSDDVVADAAGRITMVQVTPKPQAMSASISFLCASTKPSRGGPHDGHYFDVYITSGGTDAMRAGKGAYPVGTVILKRKYQDETAKQTLLFTGMRKHKTGYDPENGDWEYFTTSGDGKTITSHGAMESCATCHETYAATDYVTRDYEKRMEFLSLPNAHN